MWRANHDVYKRDDLLEVGIEGIALKPNRK